MTSLLIGQKSRNTAQTSLRVKKEREPWHVLIPGFGKKWTRVYWAALGLILCLSPLITAYLLLGPGRHAYRTRLKHGGQWPQHLAPLSFPLSGPDSRILAKSSGREYLSVDLASIARRVE